MSSAAIGSRAPRLDALEKVLGNLRFAADLKIPSALHLAVARAETAPLRLRALRLEAARSVPGVVRVFTASDVPGENRFGIIRSTADQPMIASDRVRFAGEAIALVAAETPEAAREGARRVELDAEPLPGLWSPAEALEPGAPLVHEKGNLLFEQRVVRGEVDEAFARARAVVGRTYRTSMVEHAYLEPEAGVAYWEGDVLTVAASTQNPHYDRDDLCRLLALPAERVRVLQAPTGGGFGGKLDLSVQPYVALCTFLTGRPSRLVYTREESLLASAKRHPFELRYRSAADADGRLLAVEADLTADTGAYASYGLAVAVRSAIHAAGPYRVPNVRIRARAVYTNHPFCGAMRGFGTPQAAFAHESQLDLLAEALGLDPLEIRLRNALRPGDATITGHVLGPAVGLVECLEKVGRVRDLWRKRSRTSRGADCLRGVGLGAMYYGIGNTAMSNPSSARVDLAEDGTFTLYTGAAEIGQGSDQALRSICAEVLGEAPEELRLVRGDTARTLNAGASSASRQTYVSGGAVLRASETLREAILEQAEDLLEIPRDDLALAGGTVSSRSLRSRGVTLAEVAAALRRNGGSTSAEGRFDPETTALDPNGQGRPYATYAFAAQVARVAVDRATAEVRVERIAAAHDVGRAIHPPGVLGQITGGAAMGLGMALMEEYAPGEDTNFDTYLVPTAADVPRLTPMYVEKPEPTGPFGAKGVGEPALIPTAPAILNALSDALGTRIDHLPANLERVLGALPGPGREE